MRLRLMVCALLLTNAGTRAEILVDGQTNEPEWTTAQHYSDLVQIQPLSGSAIPGRLATEAWLLSTPEGIAVAMKAKQPSEVARTRSRMVRDASAPADHLSFMVDFDGDGVSGFEFTVTLAGDITDAVINNETEFNSDWDGDWRHAVHEDESGYAVELLIPWSIAPMKNSDAERRTIGVYFLRGIADTGERWAYPNATWERPRFLSDFHRVPIRQYRGSSFAATPYAVARRDFASANSDYKTGVDLFWKPNGDHQFAATINPDFGQVESDQLVVNFDAIETVFSDKRPFFTENQSYFQVNSPGANLFYTRRVGGPGDDGSAADINAAVKANGTFGDFGYGVFTASEDGAAGRDFLFARATHIGEALSLGITQTWVDRPFFDRTASVTALDARWQPNSEWSAQTALLHSQVEMEGETQQGDGLGLTVDWDLAGPWRQQYRLEHFDSDVQLNDMGFQARNDLVSARWKTVYRQDDLKSTSRFSSHQFEFEVAHHEDSDGLTLGESYAVQRASEMRDGGAMLVLARYARPAWDDLISRGTGAIRQQGGATLFVERSRPRKGAGRIGWYANFEVTPNFYAGHSIFGGVQPIFHVANNLDVDVGLFGQSQSDWVIWQGGRDFGSFNAKRVELSSNLNWFIDGKQELRAKLQAIAIDADAVSMRTPNDRGELVATDAILSDFTLRSLGFQLRYRYKLGSLSDVFLVYSRGGFAQDEFRDEPLHGVFNDSFALRDDDQFLIKVAYRFAP